MKIDKIILENFRGYKKRTEISFDDLTVFIGKNDVGKSTILQALDIFLMKKMHLLSWMKMILMFLVKMMIEK